VSWYAPALAALATVQVCLAQTLVDTRQINTTGDYGREVALAASKVTADLAVAWVGEIGPVEYSVRTYGVWSPPVSLYHFESGDTGNPMAAYSRQSGDLWLGSLLQDNFSHNGFVVRRKPAGASTLDAPTFINVPPDAIGADKGWISVGFDIRSSDPRSETMYGAWGDTYGGAFLELRGVRSDPGTPGAFWNQPTSAIGPSPKVGNNGNQITPLIIPRQGGTPHPGRIVAAYHDHLSGPFLNSDPPVVLYSDNGGEPVSGQSSWRSSEITSGSSITVVQGAIDHGHVPGRSVEQIRGIAPADIADGTLFLDNQPAVFCDPGNPETVYVVFAGKPADTTAPAVDVIVAQSLDGGTTFTPPRTLILTGAALGLPTDHWTQQFMTWGACDSWGGINLLFYSADFSSGQWLMTPMYTRIPGADFAAITSNSDLHTHPAITLRPAFPVALNEGNVGDMNTIDTDKLCLVYAGYMSFDADQHRNVYVSTIDLCIDDVAADGTINMNDALAYLALWQARDQRADLNKDGAIDGTDLSLFFSKLKCPECTPP
jgi:hypothetical protein